MQNPHLQPFPPETNLKKFQKCEDTPTRALSEKGNCLFLKSRNMRVYPF